MAVLGAGTAAVVGVAVARTGQLCNNQRRGDGMGLALDFRILAGSCTGSLSAELLPLRADAVVLPSLLVLRTCQRQFDTGLQLSPVLQ